MSWIHALLTTEVLTRRGLLQHGMQYDAPVSKQSQMPDQ